LMEGLILVSFVSRSKFSSSFCSADDKPAARAPQLICFYPRLYGRSLLASSSSRTASSCACIDLVTACQPAARTTAVAGILTTAWPHRLDLKCRELDLSRH
jgi:hypothetical protein